MTYILPYNKNIWRLGAALSYDKMIYRKIILNHFAIQLFCLLSFHQQILNQIFIRLFHRQLEIAFQPPPLRHHLFAGFGIFARLRKCLS